ncbi:MAG: hypothetical protein FWB78_07775 [Treponema sp.]|nr:hypothetical protein [Treponema sp.]
MKKQWCFKVKKTSLPLHFTEVSLVSGDIMPPETVDLNDFQAESWPSYPQGETRQAEEAAMFYESLFAVARKHCLRYN